MSAGPRRIGIDLGGTASKAGALDAAGRVLARESRPTEHEQGGDRVVANVAALVRAVGPIDPARGIGLGVPGLLDRAAGVVVESPNLPALDGFPLVERVAAALGLPPERVLLENDANAAAVGEQGLGAARGVSDCAVITLGTGIGSGLVLGGELFIGTGGLAAEMGHVVVDPRGPRCGCGARGCVEALASATAARRRATERGLPAEAPGDLERLAARARGGAGPERELCLEIGRDLGYGLAPAVVMLDLRCFVIGGGFGAALDVLLPGIRRGLGERILGRDPETIAVVPAGLGADAGWIGAARLTER